MANKYNDILTLVNAGNQMGLSNTIKRDYGIPLDFTSVQETYDAAITYAATSTLAYVGQTVAVGGKLYIISDVANGTHTVGEGEDARTYDNYLAEVGSKTEGDGNTIELDGQTLKLAGLTGLDNNKTYVPSLVNGKLVWAEPDTSTADGQAAAIAALETRATTLETIVNGKAAVGEEDSDGYTPAVEGLVDKVDNAAQAIASEAAARKAAIGVKATGDTEATGIYAEIAEALQAAKDYADENDANTIYDDTEIRGYVQANASNIAALTSNVYTRTEIDGKVTTINEAIEGVSNTIAGITHFTTEIVTSTEKVTKVGVLYLIKNESVAGADKYDEYLYIEGQGAVLIGDTTTDLSGYVTNDTFAAEVATLVKSTTLTDYAKVTDVNTVLADYAKIADVVANETFVAFKTENTTAINAARTGAVADVEAKGYALAADVAGDLAKKIESATIAHSTDTAAEGVTKDGTALKIIVDAYTKKETLDKIEEKITSFTGGESAADVKSALEDYEEINDARVGAIEAEIGDAKTGEKAASGLYALIETAQVKADKGVDDAKIANDAITALVTTGQVYTNTEDLAAVKSRLTTLETAKGTHETRISTAEGEITALKAADSATNTKIGEITGNITTLTNKDAELAGLITALGTNKANVADVYTKDEVNTKVQGVIDAIPDVDFTPYAKTDDVNAALAAKANAADVYTKTAADEMFMTETEVDSRINALIVAADPDGGKIITDIQNLVKYVDDNAGDIAKLLTDVAANKTANETNASAISAINTSLAKIIQPKSSDEISVSTDGTLGIKELNVNKLVQSNDDDVLVLNGGTATVKSAGNAQ